MSWLRRRRRPPRLEPSEAYRRWAADYGRVPNALQLLEHRALEELLPELAGRSVLDVGCGPGRLVRLVRERGAAPAIGLDQSLSMVARARREAEGGGGFAAASVAALPLESERFDLVLCALVLGHVERLEPAIAELARVLRPGGGLVLSDFHPFATLRGEERTFCDSTEGRTYAVEQHLHLFADYVTALGGVGLVIEALREPCWHGAPVVFVLRARKRG